MTEITDWQPLAVRLLLALVAGFVIGYDRREHGQPAGLRTTICLAAAIAMMQANLLLGTRGRTPDSYSARGERRRVKTRSPTFCRARRLVFTSAQY